MANFVIKVAESPVKQDKNKRNYKTVTFQQAGFMETPWGLVPRPSNQCSQTAINCYEKNYLEKMDAGWSEPIFNPRNPAAGGVFQGDIVSREVEEYEIVDKMDGSVRQVSTFRTVVFGDTDQTQAFESAVKSAFRSKGHIVTSSPVKAAVNFGTPAEIGVDGTSVDA
jgi:hypothetical protein